MLCFINKTSLIDFYSCIMFIIKRILYPLYLFLKISLFVHVDFCLRPGYSRLRPLAANRESYKWTSCHFALPQSQAGSAAQKLSGIRDRKRFISFQSIFILYFDFQYSALLKSMFSQFSLLTKSVPWV